MKPTYTGVDDEHVPYGGSSGGAAPYTRTVSDEPVNPSPEFPVDGIRVVESNLRSSTFQKNESQDTKARPWRPAGRKA